MASPPEPKKLKMSSSSTATSDDELDLTTATDAAVAPKKPRFKRRKIAIFLAYCGAGYQGMQKNPGVRTIESDLEDALFQSGAVPEPDRNNPKRYDWARSARTDKGVSAAGQVVSGRFYIDPPGFVDRLNAHLSDQIRVFGFKRTTASFNAKKFCDRRRYVYLLPVFALDPNAHPDRESVMASLGSGNELVKCVECSERGRKVVGVMGRQLRFSREEEKSDLEGSGVSREEERSDLGGSRASALEDDTEIGGGVLKSCEFRDSREGECMELEKDKILVEEESTVETKVLIENRDVNSEDKSEVGNGGSQESAAILNSETEIKGKIKIGGGEFEACEPRVSQEEAQIKEESIVETKESMEEVKLDAGISNNTNGDQMAIGTGEFRYGDKERERFNRILSRYLGTHNFHNFTTRTKAEDPSARRYIISFNADRVVSIEGIEFVRCEIVGQSFMLHQIRKMIGLAVAMMRNCCPESLMDAALRKDININVPTAPEVGLYLDECFFTSYNQKWKDSHEELSMEAYAEQAEEFKLKHIFSHIASMEHKEGAVALWLHSLNHRNYPDFHFQESNGGCDTTEHAQL